MSNIRLRPNNDFIQRAELSQLLELTEHWVSDMLFYSDELKFFIHLVDDYFVLLLEEKSIEEAQVVVSRIHSLEKAVADMKAQMLGHIGHIEDLYDDPSALSEEEFRTEHEELEEEMIDFAHEFKETKAEVFCLSKKMLAVDKLRYLLAD